MHLLLKCLEDLQLPYSEYLRFLNFKEDNLIICDCYILLTQGYFGFGFNTSTKEFGLFPFNKVALIDSTNLVNLDLLKVCVTNANLSTKLLNEESQNPTVQHRRRNKSIHRPILCSICGEYMIGKSSEFLICLACNHSFHVLCWENHKNLRMCNQKRKIPNYFDNETNESENGIDLWSTEQVILWLCTINFYRIIDLVEMRNITGETLVEWSKKDNPHLDSVRFSLWSTLSDQFYKESLYFALKRLFNEIYIDLSFCNKSDEQNSSEVLDYLAGKSTIDETTMMGSYIFNISGHKFREATFFNLENCSYCNTQLIGLQKQGFHCINCQLNFHKMCGSQMNITVCTGELETTDILNSSVFGVPLSEQKSDEDGVPIFLKCCIDELELRSSKSSSMDGGRSLLETYSQSANTKDLVLLRSKFAHPQYDNTNNLVDLSDLNDTLLAKLVKLFFKELPEPLLTYGLYDSFVNSINNTEVSEHVKCKQLILIINHLPPINKAVLQYLTKHFYFIINSTNKNNPSNVPLSIEKFKNMAKSWSCIFSKTLIWPPHIMLPKMVDFKSKHQKIVQLLFEFKLTSAENHPESATYVGGEFSSSLTRSLAPSDLEQLRSEITEMESNNIVIQDWYWSDISKEEVNEFMAGLSDGYFMVRDSSDRNLGEYTLTVRKDGENKLIRILHRNGKYGFQEPCQYNSVADLINYYRTHKLSEYNNQLNLMLCYPLSKTCPELPSSRFLTETPDINGTETLTRGESFAMNNKSFTKMNNEELINSLRTAMSNCCEENKRVDNDTRQLDDFQRDLDEVIKCRKGVDRIQNWCKLHTEHIMNTMATNVHLKDYSRQCLKILNKKLNECADIIKDKDEQKESLTTHINNLQKQLQENRPKLKTLMRHQQQIIRHLKDRGVPDETFNQELNDEQLFETIRKILNKSNPINDKQNWFMENTTRDESVKLLTNAPHGSFLIRRSRDRSSYALDVKVNQQIQHCKIFQSNGYYGFVTDNLNFTSLDEIVKTFHVCSLECYNDRLDTKLLYPIKSIINRL